MRHGASLGTETLARHSQLRSFPDVFIVTVTALTRIRLAVARRLDSLREMAADGRFACGGGGLAFDFTATTQRAAIIVGG